MPFKERLLQHPLIYSLSQLILAPGAQFILNRKISALTTHIHSESPILDVGCGPQSWLWNVGLDPIGLDISYKYSKSFLKNGSYSLTGLSTSIPLKSQSVAGVWCIGLLHHLNDQDVTKSLNEFKRIITNKGYIVILDAILPINAYRRPVATAIRKQDRGQFMRNQKHLEDLLHSIDGSWQIKRYTYSLTGLEMLECTYSSEKFTTTIK